MTDFSRVRLKRVFCRTHGVWLLDARRGLFLYAEVGEHVRLGCDVIAEGPAYPDGGQ